MSKKKKASRLTRVLIQTADDMRRISVLDAAGREKITIRHFANRPNNAPKAISGAEIRSLRQRAHMSQAVFARHLNLTAGYVSQLERGTKRPSGPTLVLLNVIRRGGIEAIL
jgi:putative transcriptional regulator